MSLTRPLSGTRFYIATCHAAFWDLRPWLTSSSESCRLCRPTEHTPFCLLHREAPVRCSSDDLGRNGTDNHPHLSAAEGHGEKDDPSARASGRARPTAYKFNYIPVLCYVELSVIYHMGEGPFRQCLGDMVQRWWQLYVSQTEDGVLSIQ